jgi:putative transcriptional regulator
MSSLFESIRQGLNEAIEYERGSLPNVRVDKITITPLRSYSASEIKAIRTQNGMTQRLFAEALGVSVKTVESWEAGTNRPSGSSCRILEMLEKDNSLLERCSIVARN